MKRFFLLIALFIFGTQLFAQRPAGGRSNGNGNQDLPKIGVVSGKVVDATTNESMPYTSIALISVRTEKAVTGGLTDDRGTFLIEDIPVGPYTMEISFIGYKKLVIKDIKINREKSNYSFPDIKLEVDASQLADIELIEQKDFIETQIDKKVVNVDEFQGAESATATEVLETVPSVEVDVDGNVSLRGSQTVRILIDGKPAGITDDASSILDQIPANAIEKIEIITNPSAKYDPDGVSGIINVIMKKDNIKGYHGSVNIGASSYPGYNGGVNMNYRNNKLNFFGNYNYRYDDRFRERRTNTINSFGDTTTIFNQFSDGNRAGDSQVGKIGMDWYINKNNTLGIYSNINYRNDDQNSDEKYLNYDTNNNPEDFSTLSSTRDRERYSIDYNLNYKHTFTNPQHYLEGYANYTKGVGESTTQTIQSDTDFDLVPQNITDQRLNYNEDINDILTVAIDYSNPISDKTKIEFGTKAILRTLNNEVLVQDYDFNEDIYVVNTNQSNNFEYKEDVYAVYGILAQQYEKLSYQIGLRAEAAFTDSKLIDTDESFENDYVSLFPSIHTAYTIAEKQEVSLNYSRRINRPGTRQLNPFTDYSDPFNIRTGNPFLKPEYVNSFEAGYSKFWDKMNLTASLYYRISTDNIQRIATVDEDNITTLTYANFGESQTFGTELTLMNRFTKNWNMMTSGTIFQNKLSGSGDNSQLSNEAINWSLRSTNTLTLPKEYSVQLNIRYFGPRNIPQGKIEPIFTTDISLKKTVWNKKGTISLRVSDIFNTREFNLQSSDETFIRDIYGKRQSQAVTLSFTYNFGNLKEDTRKKDKNRDRGGDSSGGEDFEM